MKFIQYLQEASDADSGQNTHIKHLEDRALDGPAGFQHAYKTLQDAHDAINGAQSPGHNISEKFDGSPAVIFGIHPETKKFFVATKSAFNKTSKINYTPEDIERNHGHAPGLVSKLKLALQHLPKVTPKQGVFQGDLMYSRDDVKTHDGKHHFTPNTITYSQPTNTPEGKKISAAHIGIAIHTQYTGSSVDSMRASPYDPKEFKSHPDVHILPTNVTHDPIKPYLAPGIKALNQKVQGHMVNALEEFKKATPATHEAIVNHRVALGTYINSTVRTGTTPSVSGYLAHIKAKHQATIDSLKAPSAILRRQAVMKSTLDEVKNNKHHFQNILNIHGHLQKAKNEIIHSLDSGNHNGYEYHINGQSSNPEGYVVNGTTKLVNRSEGGFSSANFLKNDQRT